LEKNLLCKKRGNAKQGRYSSRSIAQSNKYPMKDYIQQAIVCGYFVL
jgi:hypothetical protein